MISLILRNAQVFNGHSANCAEGMSVCVEDDRIVEVSSTPLHVPDAPVIDIGGRTMMSGRIDAHIHAFISDVSIHRAEALGAHSRRADAVRMLVRALSCGSTTVRDTGDGSFSLFRARAHGLIKGPRVFCTGMARSVTGGHDDFRLQEERSRDDAVRACGGSGFNDELH